MVNIQIYKIKNIIVLFVFLSLMFSFFNKLPIYPLFVFVIILSILISIFYFIKQNNKILYIQLYSFLIGFYFLYSAIILSHISLNDILTYDFFRHDGNYFVSFAPLMFIPFLKNVKFNINFDKLAYIFIIIISIITLIIIILILINNFSCEQRCNVCHFLFNSHNAAGGYYMIIALLSFFYWKYCKKNMWIFLFFLIDLIALILTNSRGSLISFLLAFIYYIFETKRKYKLRNLLTILIILCLLYIYYIGYTSFYEFNINFERESTILDRVFNLWPRAIQDFFYSPLFGIGYTRYDDLPYNFEGIKYLYYINTTYIIRHTDAHAHNSFLHILAETGIIGLSLWILFFKSIFKYAKKVFFESKYNYYFIKYGLVAIIFSGFTEHRWTTPAEILPYTIYLSLFIILRDRNEKNIIYK